jgi:hypothetical protein
MQTVQPNLTARILEERRSQFNPIYSYYKLYTYTHIYIYLLIRFYSILQTYVVHTNIMTTDVAAPVCHFYICISSRRRVRYRIIRSIPISLSLSLSLSLSPRVWIIMRWWTKYTYCWYNNILYDTARVQYVYLPYLYPY